jgi:superfamily II DNA/RNA helicase
VQPLARPLHCSGTATQQTLPSSWLGLNKRLGGRVWLHSGLKLTVFHTAILSGKQKEYVKMAPHDKKKAHRSKPVGPSYLDTSGTFTSLDLGLDPRLLKAVARMNYEHPTLVQRQAIPLALSGKDLLVRAKTGSGKTAAYGLVLLQKLLDLHSSDPSRARSSGAHVFALVLVPTRELVEQTAAALMEMAYYCTDCARIVGLGGGSMAEQAASLSRGADVLVGTPAKVLAHIRAGTLDAKVCELLMYSFGLLCRKVP